ncbi:hypothetical protein [Serratia quinivorans]|uniref:hypothetical protein n=1 Tax=Serratia quinivorans TaxID=137545 RepID=UPI002179AB03|nr:hypothetical protein [Serratia quinivorans]CAI0960518.1 Uncharacterised protein [Serratia quinivorans]CAI1093900.1 Uncharacterised protein [Serratia quinivorans]CAI1142268.1 Uncharacterised protein [Serratia quinivorans]CAI1596292.1 Uncharacterised protein [Serratia quinivorans]CAI2080187.1 Uncharacterised protein [Serratia quinivorans]
MTMGIQTTEDGRHICIFVMGLKMMSRFDAVQWSVKMPEHGAQRLMRNQNRWVF